MSVPSLVWTPIPEGEGDGSVEFQCVDGEFVGAYERLVRVILGGNDLWTAYIYIRQRQGKKKYKIKPDSWICATVMHELRRPQFIVRDDAISWAENKWLESLVKFPPVASPDTPSDPLLDLDDFLKESGMSFVFWVCHNGCQGRVEWNSDCTDATCMVCGAKRSDGVDSLEGN
jgi:hypothetical protein